MNALSRAIEAVGGVSRLAGLVGVSPSAPSMWRARGSVPPQHCAEIERVTSGLVKRQDLRPNDWHRIWPELKEPNMPHMPHTPDPKPDDRIPIGPDNVITKGGAHA